MLFRSGALELSPIFGALHGIPKRAGEKKAIEAGATKRLEEVGKKERADDVPARLSKNEFVFTARAVRNAGNGDIRKGAKRMYQLMNELEARA